MGDMVTIIPCGLTNQMFGKILTAGWAPFRLGAGRERDANRFAYTVPFSLTGYPCVVVRVADAGGLPIGVQVAARPWREDVALAVAQWLEREFGGWQRPPL